MILNYTLDKSFGPAGSIVGYFLMAVGISTIHLSLSGLVLIMLGCFMAFSASGCSIDVENFKIRFSNNLFGFIKIGTWHYVHPRMKLGLSNSKMTYRVYSMSNRSVDMKSSDFRVYIYEESGRKGNAVCRFKKREEAEAELARLSDLLGLEIRGEIR
ncbi:hypothetical protein [Alkaliflexus imshenetskii]|uniref:hypothetical protein n=1 Tax=Alkaliflexus imshenetskii TaxID=286730 RepID=UPI00047A55BF|nr:hypothetical protein [Alkaliflexus imshenetskii]